MKNIKCFIILLLSCLTTTLLFAQKEVRISGNVHSDSEGPLYSVQVTERDAIDRIVAYAITDFDGNFSMVVKNTNNKLHFRAIGYKTQILEIGSCTVFNVKMVKGEDKKNLSNNNGPLIIVDDCIFEVPEGTIDYSNANLKDYENLFNDIFPEDIASIEILDAESCAIWGSRGANGVIKITTKRGAVSVPETVEHKEEKITNEANDSNNTLFFIFKPFIIVLLFFVLLFYFNVFRKSYDFKTDGICYKIKNKGQRSVSVAKNKKGRMLYGYSGNIVIPETVMREGVTYTVVGVDDDAFEKCPEITSLSIPKSITRVSGRHFRNLNAIYINDLAAWCKMNFDGCSLFGFLNDKTELYLKGIKVVDMVIPKGVTAISDSAFSYYKGLNSVVIGNDVKEIGENAFSACENLTNLTIGNSVTAIGEDAFDCCSNLAGIVVDSGNRVYDSREDCNAIIETATNTLIKGCKNTVIPNSVVCIGESAFNECKNLSNIVIPDSVTSIGDFAFYVCKNLSSIVIPDSVTTIGEFAFCGCEKLVEVAVLSSIPPIIKENTFSNYSATLYVPVGTKTAYQTAEYWNEFSKIVEVDTENLEL